VRWLWLVKSQGLKNQVGKIILGDMYTDPIADFLTRIRNAVRANHKVVEIPASNMKREMTKILFDKGYIDNFRFEEDGKQGKIKIALRYDAVTNKNAITRIDRISKPGLRKYCNATENVGGEVVCYVY
jgi:small subunit ribosomal protein S8